MLKTAANTKCGGTIRTNEKQLWQLTGARRTPTGKQQTEHTGNRL